MDLFGRLPAETFGVGGLDVPLLIAAATVDACHAEAFGVGGFDARSRMFSELVFWST
jgi:hypothetical protein